jgi:hypothetical protein
MDPDSGGTPFFMEHHYPQGVRLGKEKKIRKG